MDSGDRSRLLPIDELLNPQKDKGVLEAAIHFQEKLVVDVDTRKNASIAASNSVFTGSEAMEVQIIKAWLWPSVDVGGWSQWDV
ncbi:hypothetical protein EYF80_014722 [Liparis tanakae]|uniref:Uncharacterized protein n=1 Tax=Liparis tanakae TaxID=230148 RepID=A0A4Z2IAI7_9TELE|nr:hypothetical protein EYF80_014722 [Liparis tanakae]